jgi:glycosyltransferase involved in cell wall biosynthesis
MEPWERNVDAYRLATIAISIPTSDGTPVSVLEAMACEIPVIASDLPSLREWIINNENGLLVDPKDVQGLALLIQEILGDQKKQALFGKRGREIVDQRANHHVEMKKMEGLYLQLIEQVR